MATTLTKRLAEDLTDYYQDIGIKVRYLHSDIDTIERVEILRALRRGTFDVLIGINLLREGLDIPEVSLVAILDADKEGYLRSERSLIQTIGRAARNVNGQVLMYADTLTVSMRRALDETKRRRRIQSAYNKRHRITPQSIQKALASPLVKVYDADYADVPAVKGNRANNQNPEDSTIPFVAEDSPDYVSAQQLAKQIEDTRKAMQQAAAALEFEEAAELRNRLHALEQQSLGLSAPTGIETPEVTQTAGRRSAKKTGGRRASRRRAKTAKGGGVSL